MGVLEHSVLKCSVAALMEEIKDWYHDKKSSLFNNNINS